MKYSNELKSIDTQEKAYLLGLIYGDGYNGGHKYCSYKIMISSNNVDLELYEKLQLLFLNRK